MGTEGRVGGDGDAFALGVCGECLLNEVWVVLDLKGRRAVTGVFEEIEDGDGVEVGDTNGFGESDINAVLHGLPGLTDGGLGLTDVGGGHTVEEPSRGVADSGVDVLEGNG